MLQRRLPTFAAALWWGSLTAIGFMVVPMLFVHLPSPAMAGQMAAKLFTAQTWLSTVCALLLLLISKSKSTRALVEWAPGALSFIAGGLLLALLGEFAVSPRIVARENLRLWHGIGSGMYLLQWLCAGITLWKLTPRDAA